MAKQARQWITSERLAERLTLKETTLRNWRSRGIGPPYYKVGRRVVYDLLEVDVWVAASRWGLARAPGIADG